MSNGINQQVEIELRLRDYHHKTMESRRAIGFKAFLSLVALELILLKGAFDFPCAVSEMRAYGICVYIILCILFIFFMWQIEKCNAVDRRKYRALENSLWKNTRKEDEDKEETRWEKVRNSWAATWTVLTVVILTVLCCLALYKV